MKQSTKEKLENNFFTFLQIVGGITLVIGIICGLSLAYDEVAEWYDFRERVNSSIKYGIDSWKINNGWYSSTNWNVKTSDGLTADYTYECGYNERGLSECSIVVRLPKTKSK